MKSLTLITSTGNDDLRGGSNPGDNCTVIVRLANGQVITLNNVNNGQDRNNFTDHNVNIPIPAGGSKVVKSPRSTCIPGLEAGSAATTGT